MSETIPADQILAVTIDGERHELHVNDLTHADAAALRKSSHGAWRIPTLWQAIFETDPPLLGLEEAGAVVFLARRQAGTGTSYDSISASLTARTELAAEFIGFDIEVEVPEVVDSPPASGE